jgi:hypothetical protein
MGPRPPDRVAGSFVVPAVDVGRLRLRGDAEALCRVVREGDPQSAWFAAECLGDLGNPAAADTLLWCLEVPSLFPNSAGWPICPTTRTN